MSCCEGIRHSSLRTAGPARVVDRAGVQSAGRACTKGPAGLPGVGSAHRPIDGMVPGPAGKPFLLPLLETIATFIQTTTTLSATSPSPYPSTTNPASSPVCHCALARNRRKEGSPAAELSCCISPRPFSFHQPSLAASSPTDFVLASRSPSLPCNHRLFYYLHRLPIESYYSNTFPIIIQSLLSQQIPCRKHPHHEAVIQELGRPVSESTPFPTILCVLHLSPFPGGPWTSCYCLKKSWLEHRSLHLGWVCEGLTANTDNAPDTHLHPEGNVHLDIVTLRNGLTCVIMTSSQNSSRRLSH